MMNLATTDLQVPCDTRLGNFHPLGNSSEDEYFIAETDNVTVAMVSESFSQQTLPDVDLDHLALTDKQRQKLETLLLTGSDIFSAHDHDYEHTDIIRRSIKTTYVPPIRQRAYRTSPQQRSRD